MRDYWGRQDLVMRENIQFLLHFFLFLGYKQVKYVLIAWNTLFLNNCYRYLPKLLKLEKST